MADSHSLKRQILTAVSITILINIAVSAVLTGYIASTALKQLARDYVGHSVKELTKHSAMILKTRDPARADTAVATLRSLAGIQEVQFFGADRQPLWSGTATFAAPQNPASRWEDEHALHFFEPVLETRKPGDFDDTGLGQDTPRLLGHLYVRFDTTELTALIRSVYLTSFLLPLISGVLMMLWVKKRTEKLIEPLSTLSETMVKAGDTQGIRARLDGPNEARRIAEVFNHMMDRQENQRAVLEAEVEARTSELKETRDAALSASRLKSAFISTLSHEIRTPLAAMVASAEYATEEAKFLENSSDVQRQLRTIIENGETLLIMVDDTLSLARTEAGKTDLSLEEVDLNELAQRLQEAVTPLANQNGNHLTVSLAGPEHLRMDRGKLYHIMLNLLTNACKFTHNGQVTMTVTHADEALTFLVADTGIGIPPDQLPLIFEPFHRISGDPSSKTSGVGLGLAITNQFCTMLNGEIAVVSTPDSGSTFQCRIPLPVRPQFERV